MTLNVPYRSIPDMFVQRVAQTPDQDAYGGPGPDEKPVWYTWAQVGDKARAIAAGLVTLGVQPEDRVAILCTTRVDWLLADMGIMFSGAATTTVYPTTEPEDACFIVSDSGSKVLIAENAAQADKMDRSSVPGLTHIVLIDGEANPAAAIPQLTMADLSQRGTEKLAEQPGLVDEIIAGIQPDHLATLIYTSGTTGRPKGVELLHQSWCWQGVAQSEIVLSTDRHFLWLPLSHSFGKAIMCGAIGAGAPTYVDGRVDKIIDNLALYKPTLMCAAPRIFEKVYNRVVTQAKAAGGAKAKIFAWAVKVGRERVALEQARKPIPGGLAFKNRIAQKLVFSKLQERLGGNMRYMVSGSAPLAIPISEFFAAASLPVSEGYGLTETSAGNCVNRDGKLKIGTCGQPLGDLEVKIAPEDGEILIRGVAVMRGYHNLPEETASVFTEDGFFRTGDIGELDGENYIKITDRKKDLVKTSGGKYIAPTHIEGMFKALNPYLSQALVIGQARNYCTLIVTLDPEAIGGWAVGTPLEGKPYAEIVASPEAHAMVQGYVDELNSKVNRWETIKKFTILPRDLTIEDGEITPSLKMKRRVIEQNFADQIEKMYEGSVATV